MPSGMLVVVIVIVSGEGSVVIVMLSCLVVPAAPDTALTVKREVPDAVGVPEIVPVEALRVSPAGRLPELTDHAAPEGLDVRVALYAVPNVPDGSDVVVIVSTAEPFS